MPTINYGSIPSVSEFKHDSSIMFATRSEDAILTHLDWLLSRYRSASITDPTNKVIVCDIFLTANYWIKLLKAQSPRIRRERYPAVLALFERAAFDLCTIFGCKLTEVGYCITEIFGRDLTDIGRIVDRVNSPTFYDEQALKMFRLRFKAGRAYHFEQNRRKGPMRLVPLNSADYYENITVKVDGKVIARRQDWSPFVLTLEREFYMSRHSVGHKDSPNIFHSAYTRGGTVAAAGSMLIKNGQILGMRGDSGHYQPRENNIALAITALGMHSVPLMPIEILSFDDKPLGNALDFVRSRLTWDEFEKAAKDFRDRRKANAAPVVAQQNNGPVVAPQNMVLPPEQQNHDPINYN